MGREDPAQLNRSTLVVDAVRRLVHHVDGPRALGRGAVVALILTFAFSGQPVDPQLEPGFDKGHVFGFLLLLCATIGAMLGAVVALLIDRASAKRARSVEVVHESTHRIDD